jgi:protein ImuB
MKRVASLYLPEWAVERLRRRDAPTAPPPDAKSVRFSVSLQPLVESATAERAVQCDAPANTGWRPGARWAREEQERAIAALPAHQRPPTRDLGRRSEAAASPFRAMRPDEGAPPTTSVAQANRAKTPPMAEAPLVLSHKIGSRVLIAAASPAARALGITAGMALTQARACVPDLVIRDAEPERDRADLERLAVALARRWSPIVAVSDDDGLLIDLHGVAHLHGGEARMAARLARLLARSGVTARIAIADTAGAAWAIARHSRTPVTLVAPGTHVAVLAPLPVAALRLDHTSIDLLQRLGVDTIGQLSALPRAPLVRRFGKVIALRLDQAAGDAPEPLDPVPVPAQIIISQRFAEPIATPEAIEHWLGQLITRLADELAKAGLGARALLLWGERVDNQPQVIRIGFARPNRDAAHILRLIVRRIEEIEPGYGIDMLSLRVLRADPLGPELIGTDLTADQPPDLAPLVDTLANRIGAARVWRSGPVESDVPERSVEYVPPLDPPKRAAARLRQDDISLLDDRRPDHPWHPRWPRPVRLLRRPELLDHVLAELPDQPPKRFTWRGVSHRVVCADGPERIEGEWWKRSAERHAVRDYFQVEDEDGRRFWLFRRGDGERAETGDLAWFMHGSFG